MLKNKGKGGSLRVLARSSLCLISSRQLNAKKSRQIWPTNIQVSALPHLKVSFWPLRNSQSLSTHLDQPLSSSWKRFGPKSGRGSVHPQKETGQKGVLDERWRPWGGV